MQKRMDKNEIIRLRKEYSSLSDDELIALLNADRAEFDEGVYEIVLEEARKRNLEKKISRLN